MSNICSSLAQACCVSRNNSRYTSPFLSGNRSFSQTLLGAITTGASLGALAALSSGTELSSHEGMRDVAGGVVAMILLRATVQCVEPLLNHMADDSELEGADVDQLMTV